MTEVVNEWNFFLSSKWRTSGSINDCNFQFDYPIVCGRGNNLYLRVNSVNVPFSFFTFQGEVCKFYIRITHNTFVSPTITLTIPQSNPNITELNNYVLSEINGYCQSVYGELPGLTITYLQGRQKNTFNYTNVNFNEILIYVGYEVPRALGIRFHDLALTANFTVEAVSCVNISPIYSLFLRSGNVKPSLQWEALLEKMNPSDILCEVPIMLSSGFFIRYDRDREIRITNRDLNFVNFFLSSTQDYILELNGLDWSVSFSVIEKKDPSWVEFKFVEPELVLKPKKSLVKINEEEKAIQDAGAPENRSSSTI